MAFRTIVVSSHSKLEYSLNYLVFKTANETKRINISEIQTLIIESTAVSITSSLLVELMKQKIKVIFCDEKKNPNSELIPYYGDSISYKRINEQINWGNEIKDRVWKEIIKEKIFQQSKILRKVDEEAAIILNSFANEVENGDISNREGHAAKYYFNRVFGSGFVRNSEHIKNIYLNYGYSLLLSQINKYVVAKGYLTQLGIHHKNTSNQFNLSCDLIEPLRPIIDNKVLQLEAKDFKKELIDLLTQNVIICGQKQTLTNAIGIYCNSVFSALNTGDLRQINFIEKYE